MHSTHNEATLDLKVVRRRDVAEDTIMLELADPSGNELPEWAPGAHIDLKLGPGLERQYSLCGEPSERGAWRIGILREPRGRGRP